MVPIERTEQRQKKRVPRQTCDSMPNEMELCGTDVQVCNTHDDNIPVA